MTTLDADTMPRRKRHPALLFIMPLFFGLIGLIRVMESPQFPSYRTLHVIQLILSGACLGATLTALLMMLLRPRH